ncbi:hypothetical protein KJA15_01280 [Patescibacteria group bacterium]|nr:hypothetical protein [Patescibacteria group bacterium]
MSKRKFKKRDGWDFTEVPLRIRQGGVHFFHHYTAKFIPQIPEKFIKMYSQKRNNIVVDPFMGCGTTLVVAKLIGCHSYGVDTNPLAVKITKVKTMVVNKKIVEEIDDFIHWISSRKEYRKTNNTKSLSKTDFRQGEKGTFLFEGSKEWFRNDVAGKIKNILNRTKVYDEHVRDFIKVGVSDLLKGMSNARMDINVPTLPSRPIYIDKKHYYRRVNNRTRYIPVYSRVLSQVLRMKKAILEFNKNINHNLICKPKLGDARELSKHVKSCNLVITSPPYWSAQNYQKLHMLSFKLFGLNIDEEDEIGRNGHDHYQKDMVKVQEEIAKILKGYYGLVIGKDKRNREHLKLVESAKRVGFKLVDRFVRRLSNQTFFSKQIKNEFIYVFKV